MPIVTVVTFNRAFELLVKVTIVDGPPNVGMSASQCGAEQMPFPRSMPGGPCTPAWPLVPMAPRVPLIPLPPGIPFRPGEPFAPLPPPPVLKIFVVLNVFPCGHVGGGVRLAHALIVVIPAT